MEEGEGEGRETPILVMQVALSGGGRYGSSAAVIFPCWVPSLVLSGNRRAWLSLQKGVCPCGNWQQ